MTIAESIQLSKEQIARAFGVPVHMLADPDRTAVPRYWSLCMTSENHGTVGPAGCTFSHAPDKHERVLVVEVPAAAGAPVDQVSLQLVTSEGGQADVDRALRAAQAWANEEYMCGRRMGKGEPALSGRADAAKTECIAAILALAAPAAIRAAQVEAPEGFVLIPEDAPAALVVAIEREVESQLDASGISRADMCRLDGSEIFDALFEAATQASTSGERQEGGAA